MKRYKVSYLKFQVNIWGRGTCPLPRSQAHQLWQHQVLHAAASVSLVDGVTATLCCWGWTELEVGPRSSWHQMECKWLIRVWFMGKNNLQLTTGGPPSSDKGTQDTASWVFEVQPESRVMKSGAWRDEVREANAFMAPDKPRFAPLIHLCLVSTELCSPAARGHCSKLCFSPDAETDQMGQKKQRPRAPWTAGWRRTNTITVLHNMQGVLKQLTPCQKEVPRLRRWNKPGLTGVRQSGCSRQNHARPTWHIPSPALTLSTSIVLPTSTPSAVSLLPVWGLFSSLISVC